MKNEKLEAPIRKDRKPLQDLIPLKQPLRVYIDPCDICNFRCHFCFQSKTEFNGQVMNDELFDLVIDQLKEFDNPINVIHLYGYGEPLINKNITRYVEIIRKENIAKEIIVTTNGSLLTREMSLGLISAGLTRLSVSLNGLTTEQFRNIAGVNVSFDKLYEELKYFYQNRGDCHLHIKIAGDDYTREEKEKFIELFGNYCDSMNIDEIADMWPGLGVSENIENNMYGNVYKEDVFVCPTMFYNLTIHADGTISPCGLDWEFKRKNLGNVRTNTIKNIWQGDELHRMWKAELSGEKSPYDICNKCNKKACATVDISPYRESILEKL